MVKTILNVASKYADDLAKTIASTSDDAAKYAKACSKSSLVQTTSIHSENLKELCYKPKAIVDTLELSTKTRALNYIDDGIYAFDGNSTGASLREEMRDRILSRSMLNDASFTVKKMDNAEANVPQLVKNSKYYDLGVAKLNSKTNQYIYICENLRDMPDLNGLRGKTPLSGKEKGLMFRLGKIKAAGVETVIDLRASGECSQAARKTLDKLNLNYLNFPVEDCQWTLSSLDDITKYINTINKGNFYVGCANGEARTDLAVAINYILNPQAKGLPKLYFGSTSSSRVSIKENLQKILDVIEQKPEIVNEWGWKNFAEFKNAFNSRFGNLISSLSAG